MQLSVVCYKMSFGHSAWSRFLKLEKMLPEASVSMLEKVMESSRCQCYINDLKTAGYDNVIEFFPTEKFCLEENNLKLQVKIILQMFG